MQSTRVISGMNNALESDRVEIESQLSKGFTGIQLIGNTSEVCRDGKERVKAALEKCGYKIPEKKIIISLSPADLKKDSNHFDLPMAVSLSLLLNQTHDPKIDCTQWLFAAELGLSGDLKPVKGIVSLALKALEDGLLGMVVSAENLKEVEALSKIAGGKFKNFTILGFSFLNEVLSFVFFAKTIASAVSGPEYTKEDVKNYEYTPNFDDMVLTYDQELVAKCVATGLHSVLLRGSPGTGKSMFSSRLASIFPVMHAKEQIEAMQIQSAFSQNLSPFLLKGVPPFRSPHHSASSQAILGTTDQPGEISLAHGGILFLDEFVEFRRDLIESLREPLESGVVHVSRAAKKTTWKASTTLVSACNNCPCGYFGSKKKPCVCRTQKLLNYKNKLSGPILDRMDIHFNMPEPNTSASEIFLQSSLPKNLGKSERMKNEVETARDFSRVRNKKFNIECNRDLVAKDMIEVSKLSESTFMNLLKKYGSSTASSRSMLKSLKVARTLADLSLSESIREEDFQKAWEFQLEYTSKERGESSYDYM